MANDNRDRRKLKRRSGSKKKNKKGIFIIPLFIFLLLASILIVIYNVYHHSYFKISQVFIDGNVEMTNDEILSLVDNPVGNSIFTYDADKYADVLEDKSNIKKAKVIKVYPDEIKVSVEEIYPFMQIRENSTTYTIANTGELLDSKDVKNNQQLIAYVGPLDNKKTGEKFSDDSKVLKFIEKLQTYQYAKEVRQLNLENEDDVGIIVRDIQIEFGDLNNANYKLKLLDSVLTDIDQKGVSAQNVDLTQGDNPVVKVDKNL